MHIDRAGIDIDVAAPNPVQQGLAAKHPTGFFHKGGQQAKLGWPQFQQILAAMHAVGFGIKPNILPFQHQPCGCRPGAAQLRAQTRHQL